MADQEEGYRCEGRSVLGRTAASLPRERPPLPWSDRVCGKKVRAVVEGDDNVLGWAEVQESYGEFGEDAKVKLVGEGVHGVARNLAGTVPEPLPWVGDIHDDIALGSIELADGTLVESGDVAG